MGTPQSFSVEVIARGEVSDAEQDSAVEKLRGAVAAAPRRVLFARIELSREANPAVERPAVVKAAVDVSGRPVRAHLAAPSMDLAIDGVADRIRRSIRRLAERRADRAHKPATAEPGEWRHGTLPTERPHYFPRPPEEREIVRRKSYSVPRISPEEAAFDMDLLHQDFHLFVDAASGADAVIARREDGGLELHSADPQAGGGPAGEPADLDVLPATQMPVEDAVAILDVGEARFLAYVDADGGRLNLLYRRYDGHYGVVAPASED
jgi:ribosome-associated translation inhibitor RaiA